jgi:monoamine oxidase
MAKKLNYLDILRNGLPAGGSPRQVVVVGAGMAGLTAALLLKEAGHTVTILEAQNRLGGRIYTYRGFAGEMYGEFGAMRFPRQHPLVQYLIQERFKLATRPFPMEDEDTFIYLHGHLTPRSQFHLDQLNLDLTPQEKEKPIAQLLRDAVQPLIDIMETEEEERAWERLVAEFDQYSLIGYLKARGLSDTAVSIMGPLLNLEPRYHFSLVEWFAHYYDNVFGDLVYISDGADRLPCAFEPYLLNDIRLGAEVHAISQGEDQVTVYYHTAGAPGQSQTVTADECLLTVPFSLLRHLEIEPLDPDKWFAIRNAYYDRAHKIFMQFSERWWENNYDITHGLTVTDLAIRNVVYTPAGQDRRYQKGVIITSYGWGQDSMAYSPLPEQARIAQALEDLAKIHPEAVSTFEFGISHDWALDQYAGGIGPLFRPYEMSGQFYEDLIRPVHRIWFANDACDRHHRRWVEGAILAAIRNAYAIHTGRRNEIPWKD